jgi:hypothetical protein
MMEFTDFADLNAIVLAAPTVVLAIFAITTAWMNRVPSRVRAFELAPAFGL